MPSDPVALTSALVSLGLPPMISFLAQNLPEALYPQLWIPHWLPTRVSAAQARRWPARGPVHRGWETAGKEEVRIRPHGALRLHRAVLQYSQSRTG